MLQKNCLAPRFLSVRGQGPGNLTSSPESAFVQGWLGSLAKSPLSPFWVSASSPALTSWKEGVGRKHLLVNRALLGSQQIAKMFQATLQRESVLWEKKPKKWWETGPLASEEVHDWVPWVCLSLPWPQRLLEPSFNFIF